MFKSHWPTERIACMGAKSNLPPCHPQPPSAASVSNMFIAGLSDILNKVAINSEKTMNAKNTKKSPIHENADANITCDFGDRDISCFRSRLPHR